ncbi:TPA: hemagglutinin repeat-containing protein [Yersinia enterocolitica]|nr:hemagglutinin repeat-containing protein [Yersinia enterocolitica]HDL6985327.1 hemagglutinin repeat-containing protein [Yersinia enterocolitica]HDL7067867.1 hemagglutinin repeat-containing protein [Yersinia enterocolitica]HDL7072258.1 hemagglutinin repeat-containing protein [Yersinia enterocolitica]
MGSLHQWGYWGSLTYTESQLKAGDTVSITSGRDTVLKGAQVSGETVKVDAGRNLTLQSEQDRNNYDSKQTSVSASGSFTFGTMTGSGSISASKSKIDSDYTSVQEQTGFFAGKGGFDITVGEHTQLNGAVIGSTATADKNKLDTGSLGFSDLDNQARFKTSTSSMGLSSGGFTGSKDIISNMGGGIPITGGNSGDASSTTHAAVSDGTITIRDTDKQQQNVTDLSRDVEHANNALSPIFDKEKEQNRLREINLIGEIGNQVSDVIRTQGDIDGLKAAKEKLGPLKENATEKDRAEYMEKLRNSDVYKDEMKKNGTGSALQQGVQAATAAIQGLAGGDMAKALADAVAGAQAGKNAVENNFLLQILVPPPPVAGQAPQSEANTIIAQKLDAAVKEFGRDVVKQCLSGGDCPMPVQIALLAIQAMMGQDDNGLSNTGGDQIAGSGPTDTGETKLQVTRKITQATIMVRLMQGQIILVEIKQ